MVREGGRESEGRKDSRKRTVGEGKDFSGRRREYL